MKKKIGSSKSVKKMAMGGPGPTDSIPSGPKISPELLDKMKKRVNSPYNKNPSEVRARTMEYVPGRDGGKQSTMEYVPSRDDKKYPKEYYKKGGSVGKPKMAKGGSFGMLSVKAGVDKNPKATAADRIAGAKMKKGGSVKAKKK